VQPDDRHRRQQHLGLGRGEVRDLAVHGRVGRLVRLDGAGDLDLRTLDPLVEPVEERVAEVVVLADHRDRDRSIQGDGGLGQRFALGLVRRLPADGPRVLRRLGREEARAAGDVHLRHAQFLGDG
jgi:hypothetical protein